MTGFDEKLDVGEHLGFRAGGVREMEMACLHTSLKPREGWGTCRRGRRGIHFPGFFEEFANALGGTDGFLDLSVEFGDLTHRAGDEGGVEDETGELSERDMPLLHQTGSGPEDENDPAEKAEDDEGDKRGPDAGPVEGGLEEALETGAVTSDFVSLVGEGLHIEDSLEGFLDDGRGVCQPILGIACNAAGATAEHDGSRDQHGERAQHDGGQLEGGGRNEKDATHEEGRLTEELRQHPGQGVLDLDQV